MFVEDVLLDFVPVDVKGFEKEMSIMYGGARISQEKNRWYYEISATFSLVGHKWSRVNFSNKEFFRIWYFEFVISLVQLTHVIKIDTYICLHLFCLVIPSVIIECTWCFHPHSSRLLNCCWNNHIVAKSLQGLYSLSRRTSYRRISWSLEATRFGFILFQSLWNLTSTSAAALSRCLSNFRAIRSLSHLISWPRTSQDLAVRHLAESDNGCISYCYLLIVHDYK